MEKTSVHQGLQQLEASRCLIFEAHAARIKGSNRIGSNPLGVDSNSMLFNRRSFQEPDRCFPWGYDGFLEKKNLERMEMEVSPETHGVRRMRKKPVHPSE